MSMKAFPMDSDVKAGEDGLPVYDRAFDSTDLREIYKTYFSTGYFATPGTSLQVVAGTGLNAVVKAGKCNIEGTLGFMTEDAQITFPEADKTNPRIDTVVARLDLAQEARNISILVVQGIAKVAPTRTELVRNETVYDIGLADVRIEPNAAAVGQDKITDTRMDPERCGVVNPFAKLDTEGLFAQVTEIINNAKGETDKSIAELEKATQDAINAQNEALAGTLAGQLKRLGGTFNKIADGTDLNTCITAGTFIVEKIETCANKPVALTEKATEFALYKDLEGVAVVDITRREGDQVIVQHVSMVSPSEPKYQWAKPIYYDATRTSADGGAVWSKWLFAAYPIDLGVFGPLAGNNAAVVTAGSLGEKLLEIMRKIYIDNSNFGITASTEGVVVEFDGEKRKYSSPFLRISTSDGANLMGSGSVGFIPGESSDEGTEYNLTGSGHMNGDFAYFATVQLLWKNEQNILKWVNGYKFALKPGAATIEAWKPTNISAVSPFGLGGFSSI